MECTNRPLAPDNPKVKLVIRLHLKPQGFLHFAVIHLPDASLMYLKNALIYDFLLLCCYKNLTKLLPQWNTYLWQPAPTISSHSHSYLAPEQTIFLFSLRQGLCSSVDTNLSPMKLPQEKQIKTKLVNTRL